MAKDRRERLYDAIIACYDAPRRLGAWIIAYGVVAGTVFATILAGPMAVETLIIIVPRAPGWRIALDTMGMVLAVPALIAAVIAFKFIITGLIFVVFGPFLLPWLKRLGERALARQTSRMAEILRNLSDEERAAGERQKGAVLAWTGSIYLWAIGVLPVGMYLPEGALPFVIGVAVAPLIAMLVWTIHWSIIGRWRYVADTQYAREQGWSVQDIKPPFWPRGWRRKSGAAEKGSAAQ